MAGEAKVRSVESLEYFRSALINFLTKSRQALNHADDGVKLLIAAVDKDDPRPLWYSDWGSDPGSGINNLKRALDRVLKERGPKGYAQFKSRLRLSSKNVFGEHTFKTSPPFSFWVGI